MHGRHSLTTRCSTCTHASMHSFALSAALPQKHLVLIERWKHACDEAPAVEVIQVVQTLHFLPHVC